MKRHFYRTVGKTKKSIENFNTLIIQIEAILNLRKLKALLPNEMTIWHSQQLIFSLDALWQHFWSHLSRTKWYSQQVQGYKKPCPTTLEEVVRGILGNTSTRTKVARLQAQICRKEHCYHHGREYATIAWTSFKDNWIVWRKWPHSASCSGQDPNRSLLSTS